MSVKSTKLFLTSCLLLGVLLSILGCALSGNPNSNPVRSLTITIDVDQREELFTQLRKFADKHSLEFVLSFYDADEKIFLLEMNGEDYLLIMADPGRSSPGEFDIDFFNQASPPISQEKLDELVNDLKRFLNEIPNVVITELP